MALLIPGGTLVDAAGSRPGEVLVEGELIAAVGERLDADGATVIDASGALVIPGGVDAHTHFDLPVGAVRSADDFESGTVAAACGGTTCVIDFAGAGRESPEEALEAWHAKAEGRTVIDYAFHLTVTEVPEDPARAMALFAGFVEQGVASVKLYLAYPERLMVDPATLGRALAASRTTGVLVAVHAEDGLEVERRTAEALASGRRHPGWIAEVRPPEVEADAVRMAGALAAEAGAPVYVVHLSSGAGLEAIHAARAAGATVFAETCPQYLFLSLDDMKNGFEGAKFVCSPPLRPADHQAELWTGLVKDDLQLVSTDHCPFDFHGQKELGRGDFRKVPNGLPGVEDRVDLLHDGGVVGGRITRERWVEIVSTAPAKLFGMYPRKGAIAVGSDADLVVYDPNARRTISAKTHHMDVDYSCYEGRTVQGRSDVVLSRGSVVVRNGEFTGRKGHGRFVKRATADLARMT